MGKVKDQLWDEMLSEQKYSEFMDDVLDLEELLPDDEQLEMDLGPKNLGYDIQLKVDKLAKELYINNEDIDEIPF